MQKPLEITFRDIEKTRQVEDLIRLKAQKLERICENIISCAVVVEMVQKHQAAGRPYRVRINLMLPRGKEIIVSQDPKKALDLEAEVRWAFDSAERQIIEYMEKLRRDVKSHPSIEADGVVEKIFRADGVGFIRTFDDRQVFFHHNALVNQSFDDLREGAAVRIVETMGEKGPQAASVHVIGAPPKY